MPERSSRKGSAAQGAPSEHGFCPGERPLGPLPSPASSAVPPCLPLRRRPSRARRWSIAAARPHFAVRTTGLRARGGAGLAGRTNPALVLILRRRDLSPRRGRARGPPGLGGSGSPPLPPPGPSGLGRPLVGGLDRNGWGRAGLTPRASSSSSSSPSPPPSVGRGRGDEWAAASLGAGPRAVPPGSGSGLVGPACERPSFTWSP